MLVFYFILWMVFGSFISVLVRRLKNKQSWILLWRSKCPNCNTILWAKDLVPIFSYLTLKWKCRYCWKKISPIYPILELVSWIVFVLIAYLVLWNFSIESFLHNWQYVLYGWLVGVFIIALSFYDILFYEINFFLAGLLAIILIIPQLTGQIWDIKLAIILAISGFILFLWISFLRLKIRKIEWMGGGDAIWAALIGLLTPMLIDILGLHTYPSWLIFYIIILMWFFLGGFVWILGLMSKKLNFLSKIPFLPFMFGGVILFCFVGKFILDWIF